MRSFNRGILVMGLVGLLCPVRVQAALTEEINYKARIVEIIEEEQIEVEGIKQWYQKFKVIGLEGDITDKEFQLENGNIPLSNVVRYKKNEKVVITESIVAGEKMWMITDSVRTDGLLLLTMTFVLLTLAVAKTRGLTSVLSLVFSFLIIIKLILPMLLAGNNPIFVASMAAVVIIPITFFMSHGVNKKTMVAIVGTVLSLVVTAVLASIFIGITRLNGFSSEESGLLSSITKGSVDLKGLLLAGIIIGALGVLDDITVAQAGIVKQLKETSPKMKIPELYSRAMAIGQDHITSMVNTLVLVYAGASLPLLLIFVNNSHPFGQLLNYEFIAEEIVRTLVGSIGLILAVPITTILAAIAYEKEKSH